MKRLLINLESFAMCLWLGICSARDARHRARHNDEEGT